MLLAGCSEDTANKSARAPTATRSWVVDSEHSSIEFRVSHYGLHNLIGWFEDFAITIHVNDQDLAQSPVVAIVNLSSIRMPNPNMVGTLFTGGFFHAEKYPEAIFASTSIDSQGKSKYVVNGILTINGVSRPTQWHATLNRYGSWSTGAPGFTVDGFINRPDFEIGGTSNDSLNSPPHIADTVFVRLNVRFGDSLHLDKTIPQR